MCSNCDSDWKLLRHFIPFRQLHTNNNGKSMEELWIVVQEHIGILNMKDNKRESMAVIELKKNNNITVLIIIFKFTFSSYYSALCYDLLTVFISAHMNHSQNKQKQRTPTSSTKLPDTSVLSSWRSSVAACALFCNTNTQVKTHWHIASIKKKI